MLGKFGKKRVLLDHGQTAKVASLGKRGTEFGVEMDSLRIKLAGVQRRKREMVEGLHQIHAERTAASGVELMMGEGRFVAPRTVEVALKDGRTRRIVGERVFLVLGSCATMPNVTPRWMWVHGSMRTPRR
jgi:pyruvate/2-oxoglutarate dehydrogenase complex dihydrolipoamide dehydrogenase (E3) component